MRFYLTTAVVGLAVACAPPSPQPQPNEMETVPGTRVETAAPDGALGNESANTSEGNVTPAEQGDIHAVEQMKPEQAVAQFARLLQQRRFDEAFQLVDGQRLGLTQQQFEERFSNFETVDAAIGNIGRTEGAAGSLYSTVQLTLSGNKTDGSAYVLTGPVTVRRVNDVPGSTAEQRSWRIVEMKLTSDPQAAERLVTH